VPVLDPAACYDALRARDERFDGRIFVGVTTTGIYCRPVCPAGHAKRENCRFFPSAAAAQEAGFRPCLRCRPETAPDTGSWRGTSSTVSRGLALIADGVLDGDDASVELLAERLGVGGRQLRRLFQRHLGASPISVAQTRRVLFAKQLIHDTKLSMGEIALAAGFGSVRRFNETFQQLFGRPPTSLRRKGTTRPPRPATDSGIVVRLRYRPPFDWPAMLSHLRARAIDGVEEVDGLRYRRTVSRDEHTGTIEVAHAPSARSLAVTLRVPTVAMLPDLVTRIRRVFDLGADVVAIAAHLARDPLLAPLVAERPGLRVPGGWDGFEVAVRAVLGQQVSLEAGRRLAGQLVQLCGVAVAGDARLHLAFPGPARVAKADLSALAMPRARIEALRSVARAALADPRLFEPLDSIDDTVAKLCAVAGIGDWSAHYIALRCREPDAFPASDVGLLRSMAARGDGVRPRAAELQARAEPWRPWRAYAAQHLWAADASEQTPKRGAS
jgi:AraC family transcriptional regulator, regulatory protein of adaptative response / DNA-3-methyladenine glycosylase II